MEKRRIDANTIQVLITQDDLDSRGITMLDLLGSQKQIEDFFYSILDEVDTDHQFKQNDSVTFQALPTKRGLELLISKAAPSSDEGNYKAEEQNTKKPAAHKKIDFQDEGRVKHTQTQPASDTSQINPNEEMVFQFSSFENFLELAKSIDADNYRSDLYLYKNHYYLSVRNINTNAVADEVLNMAAVIEEFGKRVTIDSQILLEHGKRIMRQSAIETAAYYFKN